MTFITTCGQSLGMLHSNKSVSTFTRDTYSTIAANKTSHYTFHLPTSAAMHLAGLKDAEALRQTKMIAMEIGHFYQVQDYFLDCFGKPKVIGKLGTNIQDNKSSWLAVVCMQRANDEQNAVKLECYGKTGDMVNIKKDEAAIIKWVLGRIRNVFSGSDGSIPVPDVKTAPGIFKRLIHRLATPSVENSRITDPKEEQTTSDKNSSGDTKPKFKRKWLAGNNPLIILLITLLTLPIILETQISRQEFGSKLGSHFEEIGSTAISKRPLTQKNQGIFSMVSTIRANAACEKEIIPLKLKNFASLTINPDSILEHDFSYMSCQRSTSTTLILSCTNLDEISELSHQHFPNHKLIKNISFSKMLDQYAAQLTNWDLCGIKCQQNSISFQFKIQHQNPH
uniref:Uncharacterized protein n=1 Tax=Glossina austeni TaxID=7395 RepID=A0A1A9UIU3_GLOAU